jgi:hypothetical protein
MIGANALNRYGKPAQCLEVMTNIGSDREFMLLLDEWTVGRIALQLGFGCKRTGKPATADSIVHADGEPNVLDRKTSSQVPRIPRAGQR